MVVSTQETLFETAPLRVLVTGGRDYENVDTITDAITKIANTNPGQQITLVTGRCSSGADLIAEQVARKLGWTIEPHPADWAKHGRAAGPIRNEEMVRSGADICIAFPSANSRGTWGCIKLAKAADITVRIYTDALPPRN